MPAIAALITAHLPPAGTYLPAWVFPSRPAAIHGATRIAMRSGLPTAIYYQAALSGAITSKANPAIAAHHSETTADLSQLLAAYLTNPPPEADGRQLNLAAQLHATLHQLPATLLDPTTLT